MSRVTWQQQLQCPVSSTSASNTLCNTSLFRVAAASMGQLSSLLVLAILGLGVQGQQTQGAVAGAAAGAKQSPAVVSVLDPALYPVCVSDSDCEDISDKGDTASIV